LIIGYNRTLHPPRGYQWLVARVSSLILIPHEHHHSGLEKNFKRNFEEILKKFFHYFAATGHIGVGGRQCVGRCPQF